ncbi:RNA polymerase sigma factor [Streptomonospora litoralis]|uniref:RNA polymerase sigma factor SigM n=1 Tax=Streptomonospora litoralis TaxID=2498135 RepID=A0A4P6Q828_9ACTN|nr:RNA polymerase sigma factor [Streptomonospora litoralis]QBI55319.1 RNA polymerase sigma factor SigM [Streptomonospora litoralis]
MSHDGPESPTEPPPPPADPQARFEALYTESYGDVLGYLLRRVEDPESAADLVAEVFVTVWNRLDDVPTGPGARPWIFGVARKVLGNHRRGARRRTALAERLRGELRRVQVTRPEAAEPELGRIGAAFRSLPDGDREILTLAGWEGLDPGQIAIALGCARGTARVRLHRARRRFARALRKAGVEVGDAAAEGTRPLSAVTEGAQP